MLQQLGGLWRRLQDQSPARQALILATPVVVAMLIVLGGLIVWSVAAPLVTARPTAVAQQQPTAGPADQPAAAATPVAPAACRPQSDHVALLPTVVVPPTPTPRPATATPSPQPTNTPTPDRPAAPAIVNTEGQGANMRRAPSVSAQRVKLVAEGTVVELIGGEQRGDGYTWRNIRDVDGSTGYVIADYLQPIQAPPGATPVLPPPSIRVEEITSPVARGGEATLTIITRPGVRCELRVLIYGPDTLPREGLEVEDGRCREASARGPGRCLRTWCPGTWRYRIWPARARAARPAKCPIVIT